MRKSFLIALAITLATCSSASAEVVEPEIISVKHARGTVVGIHGGAWLLTGSPVLMAMPRPALARWRKAGWSSVNIDYHPGRAALADVRAAVRRARRGGRPVCLYGESAGGHLALMVATQMHVDCVETIGAPTDLAALPAGDTRHAAEAAFDHALAQFSPAQRSSRTPVLMAHALDDPVVAYDQMGRLPWSRVSRVTLRRGTRFYVHSKVSQRSLQDLYRVEAHLRASALEGGRS